MENQIYKSYREEPTAFSVSATRALRDQLQKIANERFGNNRSRAAVHYILLGLEAERQKGGANG